MPVKRILINGITLEQATLSPLLVNCRYWLGCGSSLTFFGNNELKAKINRLGILTGYKFIEFPNTKIITNKFQFIFEGLKRNFSALPYIQKFKGEFDIVYTKSSVLDLIIFPYFLRKADDRIKWLTVFDNTVKFSDPGKILVRLLSWVFFKISLIFLKKADIIFVISPDLKKYLMQRGFKEEKVIITGNGVEDELIRKAKVLPDCKIDALFIGRINEVKGVFDLLKVLASVKEKFPDFQLAVMGTGDTSTVQRFKDKIRDYGLSANVKFLGHIEGQEKFDIIKSSKTFLFPSYKESFGIALLEAACSGIKAFAYELEAYKNIYKNNEVLFLPLGEYKAMAMKIKKVFENDEFGNKNGELLLSQYNWEKIAEIEYNSF